MNGGEPEITDPSLARLKNGDALDFSHEFSGPLLLSLEEQRTIPAAWLEALVERFTRTVRLPLTISHAVVDGDLDLRHATFECEVTFVGCIFTGSLNGSFTHFKRAAAFQRCRFLQAGNWRGAFFETDLDIGGSEFANKTSFLEIRVGKSLRANGTQFGSTSFEGANVVGSAEFKTDTQGLRAAFNGEANLRYSRFGGIRCSGTEFKADLDLNSAKVDGDAFFGSDHVGNLIGFYGNTYLQSLHVDGNLEISGADFKGEVDLESLRVGGDLFVRSPTINERTVFRKGIDCPVAQITGNAEFIGAVFSSDASFAGINVGGDALFRTDEKEMRTTFSAEVDFSSAHIAGDALFNGTHFEGPASFSQLQVGGNLRCFQNVELRTVFDSSANFSSVSVGGNVNFDGAEFNGKTDFSGLRTEGHAFFRTDKEGNRVNFNGEANFRDANIKQSAEFDGADFQGIAIFNRTHFGSSAYFRTDSRENRTTFQNESQFMNMRIGQNAEFTGAIFRGEARFDNAQFESDAFFRKDASGKSVTFCCQPKFLATVFGSDALFAGADFQAGARFSSSRFKGEAEFENAAFGPGAEARFIHTTFNWGGNFKHARFAANADFSAAVATGDTHFTDAVFSGPCVFRDASFRILLFGDPPKEKTERSPNELTELAGPASFEGPVDFRGLVYERIYANVSSLTKRLEPFDRQPYQQLEASLRKAGDDDDADLIYLAKRKRERQRKFRRSTILLWAFDWIYKLIANYGIRPLRLIIYGLVLVAFGALFFSQPGAIELAKKPKETPAATAIPFGEGLYVSIRNFLPIDVPMGSGWTPVAKEVPIRFALGRYSVQCRGFHPDWYATILRVAGAILVGLGLGTVTGLLRRIAP